MKRVMKKINTEVGKSMTLDEVMAALCDMNVCVWSGEEANEFLDGDSITAKVGGKKVELSDISITVIREEYING